MVPGLSVVEQAREACYACRGTLIDETFGGACAVCAGVTLADLWAAARPKLYAVRPALPGGRRETS